MMICWRSLEMIECSANEGDSDFMIDLIAHVQMIAEVFILLLKAERKRHEKDNNQL